MSNTPKGPSGLKVFGLVLQSLAEGIFRNGVVYTALGLVYALVATFLGHPVDLGYAVLTALKIGGVIFGTQAVLSTLSVVQRFFGIKKVVKEYAKIGNTLSAFTSSATTSSAPFEQSAQS